MPLCHHRDGQPTPRRSSPAGLSVGLRGPAFPVLQEDDTFFTGFLRRPDTKCGSGCLGNARSNTICSFAKTSVAPYRFPCRHSINYAVVMFPVVSKGTVCSQYEKKWSKGLINNFPSKFVLPGPLGSLVQEGLVGQRVGGSHVLATGVPGAGRIQARFFHCWFPSMGGETSIPMRFLPLMLSKKPGENAVGEMLPLGADVCGMNLGPKACNPLTSWVTRVHYHLRHPWWRSQCALIECLLHARGDSRPAHARSAMVVKGA